MEHKPQPDGPCAQSPEMICMNCRHYDTVWLNCKFLGFDGIRENPNMRCNIEIEENGLKRFAFDMRTPAEVAEERELAEKLRCHDPVDLPE